MKAIRTTNAPAASIGVAVLVVDVAHKQQRVHDLVTIEEPLEIRLAYERDGAAVEQSVSITMRTPGNDLELAAGFLLGEGIVAQSADILAMEHCGPPSPDKGLSNVVKISLSPTTQFDPELLMRHFFTTSSCGVCGKASLEAIRVTAPTRTASDFKVSTANLHALPAQLSAQQTEFARTGGLHGAASFDASGKIQRAREDVGRHNALDKLVGSYIASGLSALRTQGLLLSGRASFELVQKAAVAGFPLIAALGPPSSLAIELAEDQNITLVGFLKSTRLNVYTGAERITGD